MEPAVPSAAAPEPAKILAQAPVLGQVPLPLPGLLSPSPLLSSRQEVDGSERGKKSLSLEALAVLCKRPVKAGEEVCRRAIGPPDIAFRSGAILLFWPKSRSFDYLYSDGETLLQGFPVQATINLYEDSNSEKEEEEEEEEDKEEEEKEADEKGPEGCVEVPGSAPHRATAHPPALLLTCPN
ncbi:hypothetical protein MC885_018944 [Smutsia gigantea]|nr:hypothetical protein MC885_018944 [Smutsia gigantea]